ncbi:MAG: ATP-binding protein [Solirubrobacterales bacterium]|nr:ATP-binding protein [Solirubrobacterales bacterium]
MPERFIPRGVHGLVLEALADTRVVVILGARQVGKSTLVGQIAREDRPAKVFTLDDHETRVAATEDPTGFIASLTPPVVVDEIQHSPELLLAIKARVDRDPSAGQFLLTGSANLLTAPRIADALTGRAEYLRLLPFSQGELRQTRETFIPTLFEGKWPHVYDAPVGRAAYTDLIVAGGYPTAVERSPARRTRFFESYIETIIQRDLSTLAQLHDQANVRKLLIALGTISGSLTNYDGLARDLSVAPNTLRAHTSLLEALFLVTRIEAWSSNLLSRVVKTPKLYVADTGLLAYLTGADAARLTDDGQLAGAFFETFVVNELRRQSSWEEDSPRQYHYRDRDGREVDVVLERRDGSVVGIEVKTAASIASSDFRGLRHLRDKLGTRFKMGVVIYTGANALPFGDRLAAVPLCGMWTH